MWLMCIFLIPLCPVMMNWWQISIPCLLYTDDIVLLSGWLQKLQIMLNICNTELTYLDLQFNALKCHVVRIGNNYGDMCHNMFIGNQPIVFTDSITYLGTLIKAGRTWHTDSSPWRRQCFRAFNSIYCKNKYLSEPAMHQLVESFCKPVLLYNLIVRSFRFRLWRMCCFCCFLIVIVI